VDYDSKSEAAQLFFKKVQNKMLWAVTGHTAPELIAGRADPALPNMGLTTWQGGRVRKQDVTIAKNYLSHEEIEALDRIVVMYLDYAEDQAQRRRTLTMRDWEDKLDAFLQFNEREVLTHAGKLRADVAEKLALERYESFDAARREAARLAADAEDMAAEQTERQLEAGRAASSVEGKRREGRRNDGNRASPIKLHEVTQELIARNGTSLGRDAIMAVTKQVGMRPMREETIAANIERYKVVPPNAFAYNPMRLNIGSIAISPFDRDVLVSPDYVVFACDDSKLLPSYLQHLRHSHKWKSHFELAGNGSVRVRIYYGCGSFVTTRSDWETTG
jgi:hypothetical protein